MCVVFSYTRKQAIADGVLVDVTEMAREAGFTVPVAMTAAVWARCVRVPEECGWQDESGRLWDVVWMLRVAIAMQGPVRNCLTYSVLVQNDETSTETVKLKAVCGPGDEAEPVITVMLPTED